MCIQSFHLFQANMFLKQMSCQYVLMSSFFPYINRACVRFLFLTISSLNKWFLRLAMCPRLSWSELDGFLKAGWFSQQVFFSSGTVETSLLLGEHGSHGGFFESAWDQEGSCSSQFPHPLFSNRNVALVPQSVPLTFRKCFCWYFQDWSSKFSSSHISFLILVP